MSKRIHALVIPKYGMVMTEGILAVWHVKEGSEVKSGDEIIDIETEKIATPYESQVGGILRRCVAQEGETLMVGALFGVIADPSVSDEEIDAFIKEFQTTFKPLDEGGSGPLPEVIDVGEFRIRYLRIGEEDGLPILLVHGFGGDFNNWLFNQEVLAVGRAVYALDLPGHGGSQKSVGTGEVKVFARLICDFLGALKINNVHVVGHSLGGGIALSLALDRPELVASLTLLSPIGLGGEINGEFINGMIKAERRNEMKAVLQTLFADPDLVSRDMVMDILNTKRIDGAVDCLRSIAGGFVKENKQLLELRARLAELAIPAQVIWGKEDRVIKPVEAANLPANIKYTLLEDVGHMPHMENSAIVNQLIKAIVER